MSEQKPITVRMAAGETRRAGRPLKPAVSGQRSSLGLKVTPSIKERLDAAARINGRTQSQEAEVRIENSFQSEDILRQQDRILTELGSIRDDLRVLTAITMRLDSTVSSILEQMHLMFEAHNRVTDRVRKLEERIE